jgi:hypothetical protein
MTEDEVLAAASIFSKVIFLLILKHWRSIEHPNSIHVLLALFPLKKGQFELNSKKISHSSPQP